MARLMDITVPLSPGVAVYPGDPPFERVATHRIADGAPYNLSRLTLGTHTGTHVDAPFHFEAAGTTVDQLSLDVLTGRARVVDVGRRDRIDRAALAAADWRGASRLLFKTRSSGHLAGGTFPADYVGLDAAAAAELIAADVRLIGIDSPSVEPFGSTDFAVHHALLRRGIVIVEGLDLSNILAGEYDLMCLPLLLAGADGAPARVVLRTLS